MSHINYVGPKHINDSIIISVEKSEKKVDVGVRSFDKAEFIIRIMEPKQVIANRAEGMMLYGLIEEDCLDGHRKYVFTNGKEKDSAKLEIIGKSFEVVASKAPLKKIYTKGKEPLISLLLSVMMPGLGHLYCHFFGWGLFFLLGTALWGAGLIRYTIAPDTETTSFIVSLFIVLIGFTLLIHIDAFIAANRFNNKHNLKGSLPQWAGLFIFLLIVVFVNFPIVLIGGQALVKDDYFETYKFPAGSMRNTLIEGDRVLEDKKIYKESFPERGDIVVFTYPKDPTQKLVKRLIAFEGETVLIRGGKIYVNDTLITHPKISSIHYYNKGFYGRANKPIKVPIGQCYVLGDNSGNSNDSRFWGFLPQENISGKIYKIFWPLERSGLVE